MFHVKNAGLGNSRAGQKRRLSLSDQELKTKRSRSGMLYIECHCCRQLNITFIIMQVV